MKPKGWTGSLYRQTQIAGFSRKFTKGNGVRGCAFPGCENKASVWLAAIHPKLRGIANRYCSEIHFKKHRDQVREGAAERVARFLEKQKANQ